MSQHPAIAQFQDELDLLIEKHQAALDEAALDLEDDPLERADIQNMGDAYCSGWVLCASFASISNPGAVHVSAIYARNGQSPFLGNGLLVEAMARRLGS